MCIRDSSKLETIEFDLRELDTMLEKLEVETKSNVLRTETETQMLRLEKQMDAWKQLEARALAAWALADEFESLRGSIAAIHKGGIRTV